MEKTKRIGDYKNHEGKDKNRRDKSNLIIPFAIIGLVVVLVISYNLPWSELGFSKIGTAKPYEKLNPELTSTKISREQAIDIATNSSVIKELWRATTPYWYDPLDTDTGANTPPPSSIITELLQDNARSYIRWVVANDSVTVWVDAKNGEIIHYSNYNYIDGNITEEEAVSLAEYFASTFNPIPSEAILYKVKRWCPLKVIHWSASDGSILETSAQEVYTVIFSRTKNDVPSDDRIEVWISTSGGLVRYQKTWTLIMPEETEPQKTREEAIDTAKNVFDGTVNDVTLMIRRPNYYWSYGECRYGITEGKLCWVVALANEEDIQAEVWVDAINGKIVGGTVTL